MAEFFGGVALAIDFGTSNTAAAFRDPHALVQEVRLSTAGPLMPSGVFYTGSRFLVGRTALQAAVTSPEAFEPSPKRRLADREILLAGQMVPVTKLVAAVFAEVLARTSHVMGAAPEVVVVTHPDQWGAALQQLLADSAIAGGVPADRLRLVSEAQAAAWFYTSTEAQLVAGTRLVVFDFGAGSCDVAVLDKQPDNTFAVVACDGLDDLGGQDMDARIYAWVRRQLEVSNPALLAQLDDPAAIAPRLTLSARIRDAKEALSEANSAAIVAAATDTQVLQLTRGEFDELIGADIDRAVQLTKRVIADAHARRPSTQTPTIYLTGGSSQIPLAHSRLAELGPLGVLGDPKTVVVQGALHAPQPQPATLPAPHPLPASTGPLPTVTPPHANSWPTMGTAPVAQPQANARKRWWIVGASVVAAGLATVIVLISTGALSSHNTPTPPAATTMRPVPSSQLSTLLLSVDQLSTIMNTTSMQPNDAIDHLLSSTDTFSDSSCEGSIYAGHVSVYAGSSYTGARAQYVADPPDAEGTIAHMVWQVAVAFASTDAAQAFFGSQSDRWKACAGKTITDTSAPSGSDPGSQVSWSIQGVTPHDDTTLAQIASLPNGGAWACQRALHAVSNVVFDVAACLDSVNNQAVDIADEMGAKVAG